MGSVINLYRNAGSIKVADGTLMDVAAFKNKVGELQVELMALEFTELRTLATVSAGGSPGQESSILKLKGTEIQQRISQLTWKLPVSSPLPGVESIPARDFQEGP